MNLKTPIKYLNTPEKLVINHLKKLKFTKELDTPRINTDKHH